MVVAVVDDMLFGSRIRAVAERSGTPLTFVRAGDNVLDVVRAGRPMLVIVDLDRSNAMSSTGTVSGSDPIASIRAIKSDPVLGTTRVLAYVSHVRADLIAAAREAGADTVLARSAFVQQLPTLLASRTSAV